MSGQRNSWLNAIYQECGDLAFEPTFLWSSNYVEGTSETNILMRVQLRDANRAWRLRVLMGSLSFPAGIAGWLERTSR
jgi:hypothetical protein